MSMNALQHSDPLVARLGATCAHVLESTGCSLAACAERPARRCTPRPRPLGRLRLLPQPLGRGLQPLSSAVQHLGDSASHRPSTTHGRVTLQALPGPLSGSILPPLEDSLAGGSMRGAAGSRLARYAESPSAQARCRAASARCVGSSAGTGLAAMRESPRLRVRARVPFEGTLTVVLLGPLAADSRLVYVRRKLLPRRFWWHEHFWLDSPRDHGTGAKAIDLLRLELFSTLHRFWRGC